jgi:UDP-4-amino-4-deoxy-L-arabinose formyltransferase/UDP-glucuronic acid dehydrogenase (UDP-4-keto-hexauronic acid decarboxylating)
MNIVLVAEEIAGWQVLKALSRTHHRVIGVLTLTPETSRGEGSSLWKLAQNLGYKTWPAELVKDPSLAESLAAEPVDLLLNVHSLYIVHPSVLAVPRLGAYNLHPAPLPRYAGLNSVSWAIYRGEKEHGVTVHKMEAGIDTGATALQEVFPIADEDTALTLSMKCTQRGVALMLKLLDTLSATPGNLKLVPQDLSQREYFGAEVPQGGQLCWLDPAETIVNFVRACDYFPFRSPWGHATSRLEDDELGVIKASRTGLVANAAPGTVGQVSSAGALVAAGDEWVLVKKLKKGDSYLAASDVLRSGARFRSSSQPKMSVI